MNLKFIFRFWIFLCALLTTITSCQQTIKKDQTSLEVLLQTPIPEATLIAFNERTPITELYPTSEEISSTPYPDTIPTLPIPSPATNTKLAIVSTDEPTLSWPYFPLKLEFDPVLWEWKIENRYIVLAHRQMPHCKISQTSGRGSTPDWSVEHTRKILGKEVYAVSLAIYKGQPKFVTYCNTWGFYNCFQVDFQEQMETCIKDAELVISTYVHSNKWK